MNILTEDLQIEVMPFLGSRQMMENWQIHNGKIVYLNLISICTPINNGCEYF